MLVPKKGSASMGLPTIIGIYMDIYIYIYCIHTLYVYLENPKPIKNNGSWVKTRFFSKIIYVLGSLGIYIYIYIFKYIQFMTGLCWFYD